MPHFDIVKENHPQNTFRVSKVEADFDVKPEHSTEHFVGNITIPEKWNVGVIVGGSGTGKALLPKNCLEIKWWASWNTPLQAS